MIKIDIDRSEAAEAENEYLDKLEGFQQSISTLMSAGRKNGVSVIIKDIKGNGCITYMENASEVVTNLVLGSTRKGKPFLTDNT